MELLWQEHKTEQSDGYQYSASCGHYRRWRQQLTLSMWQIHTVNLARGPVVGHWGGRDIDDAGDFPLGTAVLEMQPQGFVDFAHRLFFIGQATLLKIRQVATVIPFPSAPSGGFKLSSLERNQCPVCAGMGVQFAVDWVSSLARKVQTLNALTKLIFLNDFFRGECAINTHSRFSF